MPDWIVQIGFGRRAGVLVIALLNGALSTAPRSQPKWQKVQLERKKKISLLLKISTWSNQLCNQSSWKVMT
jgi:hypothetical protein